MQPSAMSKRDDLPIYRLAIRTPGPLMKHVALTLIASTLVFQTAVAQPHSPLSGTFASKGAKFQIAGGVAFTGKSNFDSTVPVILVAVTNTKLNVEGIADFVDRKRAIEHLIKDDETPVVYLEFTPQG